MFDYCTNYVKRYLLHGCIIIRGTQESENIKFPKVSCNLKLSEFPIISNYEIFLGLPMSRFLTFSTSRISLIVTLFCTY